MRIQVIQLNIRLFAGAAAVHSIDAKTEHAYDNRTQNTVLAKFTRPMGHGMAADEYNY